MKKMYIISICAIFLLTVLFLSFSCDIHEVNRKFLASYGVFVVPNAVSAEEFQIPAELCGYYRDYNLMQLECGLDLTPHCGKKAVRYTYALSCVPDGFPENIYANVICVRRRPIGGDIICPSIDGFLCPLNTLSFLND